MSADQRNRSLFHLDFEVVHDGDPEELLELLFVRFGAFMERTGFVELWGGGGWLESITEPVHRSPVPAIGPMT